MNYLPKIIALLLTLMMLTGTLGACVAVTLPDEDNEGLFERDPDRQTDDSEEGEGSDNPFPFETTTAKPNEPDDPDYPEFDTLEDLRDYLYECRDEEKLEVFFEYSGDKEEILDENYANLLTVMNVNFKTVGSDHVWQFVMYDYPGDRMARAYFSGDRSGLSGDEKQALDIAIEVVEEAQANADGEIELELLLHDWLCERVTYDETPFAIDDPDDPPRHLTAVGALLDGSANCQGYTDAFYLLATIAGFKVGRQACAISTDIDHIFNTIYLDGAWYIVDVTHNDDALQINGQGVSDYHLFNAGKDRCTHSWPELYERYPISSVSGSAYYYNLPDDFPEHGYQKTFESLEEMAESVAEQYAENGRLRQFAMIPDLKSNSAEFKEYLDDALNDLGVQYSYTIWATVKGEHTYYTVQFQ